MRQTTPASCEGTGAALRCCPALGDGPAHMLLKLTHSSAGTCSPCHRGHPPVLSLTPIWTIRARTGEASFLCSPAGPSVAAVPVCTVFLRLPPLLVERVMLRLEDSVHASCPWIIFRSLIQQLLSTWILSCSSLPGFLDLYWFQPFRVLVLWSSRGVAPLAWRTETSRALSQQAAAQLIHEGT